MPEPYIEPLTNRQECYTCQKTVTGKKKLSKCAGCHAITYCGQECQLVDRPRHKWNCVPVMVTEIPGKGRGLVAAREIKMGELIFNDKPTIKIDSDGNNELLCESMGTEDKMKLMDLILKQLDRLPSEARLQFHNLIVPETVSYFPGGDNISTFNKFVMNARSRRTEDGMLDCIYLALNTALINHSCAPNAVEGCLLPPTELKTEIRAIKDIPRGEEITICYFKSESFKKLDSGTPGRKKGIKEICGFDCNCCVCSGQVPDQQDVMKEILDLTETLDPYHFRKNPSDWKREAKTLEKIVDLSLNLYVGTGVNEKYNSSACLAKAAQMARDEVLLEKALGICKRIVDDTKVGNLGRCYEFMKADLDKWTVELKSKKPPQGEEIVFFY